MSVIIKGIEMPKEQNVPTWAVIFSNGEVRIYKDGFNTDQGNGKGTAIPIPPHVDLIDRNKLIQSVSAETCDCNPDHFDLDDKDGYGEWMLHNGINTGIVAASVRIKAAPAIIPEDEVV